MKVTDIVDKINLELERLNVIFPEYEGDTGMICKLNPNITIPDGRTAVTISFKDQTLDCDGDQMIEELTRLKYTGSNTEDLENIWTIATLAEI